MMVPPPAAVSALAVLKTETIGGAQSRWCSTVELLLLGSGSSEIGDSMVAVLSMAPDASAATVPVTTIVPVNPPTTTQGVSPT